MDLEFNPLKYPITFEEPRRLTGHSAWEAHIPFAFALIQMLEPKVFVELGTHWGHSYCAFCQAINVLKIDAKCYAIDTWIGDQDAGFYGEEVYEELKAYHDPLYGNFSKLMRCTFDEALKCFKDKSIDLLHIDGLHTYDAVKHDYETWLPKLSPQGIILFHDTNVQERDFGVYKLWEEIREEYPSFEFKHGYGLGVLVVGAEALIRIKPFLESIHVINESTIKFFRCIGQNISLNRRILEKDLLLAQKDLLLAQKDQSLNLVQSRINEVVRSVSWKITAPLRWIYSLVNRSAPARELDKRNKL